MIKMTQFTGSRHVGAQVDNILCPPVVGIAVVVGRPNMVICAVIGCSACSERDKWLTFHRFPVLTKCFGEKDFELRKKRLDGYLAAISREDIDPKSIEEHDYRICSRHFVLGKPAKFYEINSPNWLPTLHLGHMKQSAQTSVTVERYERFTERHRLVIYGLHIRWNSSFTL